MFFSSFDLNITSILIIPMVDGLYRVVPKTIQTFKNPSNQSFRSSYLTIILAQGYERISIYSILNLVEIGLHLGQTKIYEVPWPGF